MNYVEKIVKRQLKEYHKITYVDYKKEAIIDKLNKKDLENMLDWLIENDYKFVKHSTMRSKIPPKSYSFTYNARMMNLSIYDGNKYYWYSTNYHDDAKNVFTPNSFTSFKKMFKKRTSLSLLEAFGKSKQEFKVFVPKPLYYINSCYIKAQWYERVCSEDYSSHYPSSAIESLPDANTMVLVEDYVKPTEEYPFAFYPDSGNVAVYGEFDSHDWLDFVKMYSAYIKDTKYEPKYHKADKNTILMKKSLYSLENEVIEYYNIKQSSPKDSKEYQNAKIFLLKFIGMLEQCSTKLYASYPFAHLAAVIKWRSNIKMFKTIMKIGRKNIIQLCVDGIIHTGEPVGCKIEKLGNLVTKIENAKFVHRGINQYILKNNKQEERKHQGLDINTSSNNIMSWLASPKVDFLTYIKTNYLVEEKL